MSGFEKVNTYVLPFVCKAASDNEDELKTQEANALDVDLLTVLFLAEAPWRSDG